MPSATGTAGVPFEPDGLAGLPGVGSSISGTDGFYMVYSYLTNLHEPWTMGAPEIAVHVGVYEQPADSVEWKSCAGDGQSGAYHFDQNNTTWNDTVLIASKATVSEEEIEIFVWEDDWDRCDGTNHLTPHQSSSFLNDLVDAVQKYGAKVKEDFETLGDSTSGLVDYVEAAFGIVTNGYQIAGALTHDDFVGVAGKFGSGGCFTHGTGQVHLPLKSKTGGPTSSYIRVEENFSKRILCNLNVNISGVTTACEFGDPDGSQAAIVNAPGTGVTYEWKEDGVVRGTSQSYSLHNRSPGWRSLQVTVERSDDGATDTEFKSVQVLASGTGSCPE